METLAQLLPLLNGLGPWGIAIGVGLTLAFNWWKSRNPDLVKVPKPDAPLSDADRFPILSKLLKLFGAPAVKDLAPEAIDALRVELDDAAEMHLAEMDARKAVLSKGKAAK